jgi:hypothetical protein
MDLHSGRSLPIIKGQDQAIASAFLGPNLSPITASSRAAGNIYSASGDARQIAGDVLTTFTGPIDKVEVYSLAPGNQSQVRLPVGLVANGRYRDRSPMPGR